LRVRLLSIPQHRQAAAMSSAPPEMANPPFSGSERRIPPKRISAKPRRRVCPRFLENDPQWPQSRWFKIEKRRGACLCS
jgi:hypothetical protein